MLLPVRRCITGWSNWVLHWKLKYYVCCLIELFLFQLWHLWKSIFNTSISGVKSNWTTLYLTFRASTRLHFQESRCHVHISQFTFAKLEPFSQISALILGWNVFPRNSWTMLLIWVFITPPARHGVATARDELVHAHAEWDAYHKAGLRPLAAGRKCPH